MTLRCIAIDDEPFALGIISDYCAKIPYVKLEKTFHSGIEAINYLKSNRTDLIFLDIQMRDITGLQVLDILLPRPQVILITAYEQCALKSYEYQVVDYLLKPFTFERFLKAVTNALEKSNQNLIPVNASGTLQETSNYMFVKSGYSIVKINFEDIYYIEGQKDYLMVRTGKEKILTLQSFKQFEEVLPTGDFIRVHKSYMVALKKITRIERARIMILDKNIPIGESYKEYFTQALKSKMLL
jgi:DNA-binding LytR/AlgR family response regulator